MCCTKTHLEAPFQLTSAIKSWRAKVHANNANSNSDSKHKQQKQQQLSDLIIPLLLPLPLPLPLPLQVSLPVFVLQFAASSSQLATCNEFEYCSWTAD